MTERRMTNKFDKSFVADELTSVAKTLTAGGWGWTVTLQGGNRGATVYFEEGVSFISLDAAQLADMLNRFRMDVMKLMSNVKIGQRTQEARLQSGKPCLMKVETKVKFKSEEQALELADFLDNNTKIEKFNNWLDL